MSIPLPHELKPIKKFIDRAVEYEAKGDMVVGFYCRRHAVEEALQTHGRSKDPAVRSALSELLTKLEDDKKKLDGTLEITDEMLGKSHFERVTLDVFESADTEDRTGQATKLTIKKFLVANTLFEALETFGDVSEANEEKKLYCKAKMVDMLKAIKAGLPITPGPPGSDEIIESRMDDSMQVDTRPVQSPFGIAPSPTLVDEFGIPLPAPPQNMNNDPATVNSIRYTSRDPSPTAQLPPTPDHIPPSVARLTPVVTERVSKRNFNNGHPSVAKDVQDVSAEDMKRVNKLCRFCMSALMYDDVQTAVTNLQDALSLLTE
eukprot:CFRG1761T1